MSHGEAKTISICPILFLAEYFAAALQVFVIFYYILFYTCGWYLSRQQAWVASTQQSWAHSQAGHHTYAWAVTSCRRKQPGGSWQCPCDQRHSWREELCYLYWRVDLWCHLSTAINKQIMSPSFCMHSRDCSNSQIAAEHRSFTHSPGGAHVHSMQYIGPHASAMQKASWWVQMFLHGSPVWPWTQRLTHRPRSARTCIGIVLAVLATQAKTWKN